MVGKELHSGFCTCTMSCQRHTEGPGGNSGMKDPPREHSMKGTAILHQQRRLKQATQFLHKDSADLLPLDQLRRLGTSKDLQPHCVIQRRLLGSPGREPNSPVKSPDLGEEGTHLPYLLNQGILPSHLYDEKSDPSQPTKKSDKEIEPSAICTEGSRPSHLNEEYMDGWKEHTLLIPCKVFTQDVRAKLCIERQQNFISRSCAERLGLKVAFETAENGPLEEVNVDIELGTERLKSKAILTDDDVTDFTLGLQTLVNIKSCIDLNQGVLKTPFQDISFLNPLKRE